MSPTPGKFLISDSLEVFNSTGTILLKEPIYLDNETHIQSYDELIVEKDILK